MNIENTLEAWNVLNTYEQILLLISIVLLIFSKFIVRFLRHQDITYGYKSDFHLTAFRAFSLLIIAVIILKSYFIGAEKFSVDKLGVYGKIIGVVLTGYAAFVASQSIHFLLLKRFGKAHTIDNKSIMSETYNSRMLGIVAVTLITIIAIISAAHILGFQDLLKTTGAIGFFGVMLALTQASWAPDIISGLIILNSGLVEDGDVIELNDGKTIAMIHKTRLFYTEVLDLVNNHRIMIGNANLRNMSIHNLSKFASAKGLRDGLFFKIGYEVGEKQIRDCFLAAFEKAKQDKGIEIESQHPLEIIVIEAGDDAIEWGVYYYIKNTKKIIQTRNRFRQLLIEAAQERNISFATPRLYQLEKNSDAAFTRD